ncbi:hypothetical protein U1Q18_035946 [Sarracenia purpurea var. burkii]
MSGRGFGAEGGLRAGERAAQRRAAGVVGCSDGGRVESRGSLRRNGGRLGRCGAATEGGLRAERSSSASTSGWSVAKREANGVQIDLRNVDPKARATEGGSREEGACSVAADGWGGEAQQQRELRAEGAYGATAGGWGGAAQQRRESCKQRDRAA